jgi:hypothetical protein
MVLVHAINDEGRRMTSLTHRPLKHFGRKIENYFFKIPLFDVQSKKKLNLASPPEILGWY